MSLDVIAGAAGATGATGATGTAACDLILSSKSLIILQIVLVNSIT